MFYIKFIKKICAENGIELFFISVPCPDSVQENLRDFKKIRSAYEKLMLENDIKFINTYDDKFFPNMSKNSNFHDCNGHLVLPAKVEYTKMLCRYLMEK